MSFTDARLQQLRDVAPEAFAEGQVNWQVLREALGQWPEGEDHRQEHFGLDWPGKREARRLASASSRGALAPVAGTGEDEASTKNVFVEGDNFEVLKLVQKAYAGRVKLVYIDPPYNTGTDFIYRDDFAEPVEAYLRSLGALGDDGTVLTTNTKSDGRFHSKWLSMMFSRLLIARSLLRLDGFIVVSIDDAEVHHLRTMMNEVFGEENFLATLVWDKNRKNDARFFSVGHEYMLIYARDKQWLIDNDVILRAPKEGVDDVRAEFERLRQLHKDVWVEVREGLKQFFQAMDESDPRKPLARFGKVDERGPYRDDGNINWPGGGGPRYEVLHPVTGRPCKLPRSGWRYPTPERMAEVVAKGVVVFGPDESTVPRVRTNLFENADQVLQTVHYSYAQTASNQFDAIFDGKKVFDNPKPYVDLAKLVEYLTEADDLIVDFFAGSASTGHGVVEANKRTNGKRNFLLIQIPEPVNPATESGSNALALGLETVAAIAQERLRRIRPAYDEKALDTGFRCYRLQASAFSAWDIVDGESLASLELRFEAAESALREGWTPEQVVCEVMLSEGFTLDSRLERKQAGSSTVVIVASQFAQHRLLICLDKKVDVAKLNSHSIVSDDVLVCLDSALSDAEKLRLAERCNLKTI